VEPPLKKNQEVPDGSDASYDSDPVEQPPSSEDSESFADALEQVDMGEAVPPDEVEELEQDEESAKVFTPEPVGDGEYEVQQGDSIASIAFEHGHFWETIWNDPANAIVKRTRKDPYVLLPGDRVHVPPSRQKSEAAATEQRHKYVLKGVPEKLHLRLLGADGKACADVQYRLLVDDVWVESGVTDQNGNVVVSIPPNAKAGKILMEDSGEEIPLLLGGLDPITELSGVQARLQNLGYDVQTTDGEWTDDTREALVEFQQRHNLPVTGDLDDQTKGKLAEVYGG
jgi:hypothetical protein